MTVVRVWAHVPTGAASLIVLTGCSHDGGSDRLISERAARDIAAHSGWHPNRITARLTTCRARPDSTRVLNVWIVSYRGGDVCVPPHGPGAAGFGLTTFEITIDARTGTVLTEGSSGRPVSCRD